MKTKGIVVGLATCAAVLAMVGIALAAAGSLTRIQEHRDVSSGGTTEGLDFGLGIAASDDGDNVYSVAANDDTVVSFRRNANGGLVPIDLDRDVSSGGSAEGLDNAIGVDVSPDGANVYATGLNDDTVVVFRRNGNGTLTRLEEHRDPSSGGSAEGLDSALGVTVAPDGEHVYVAGRDDDTVVLFRRNATNGRLTRVAEYRDPSSGGTVEGLDGARSIAFSPDGARAYVTSQNDDAVVSFRRNANGALVAIDLDRDVSSGGAAEGLDEVRYVEVSADGENVYTAAGSDDAVVSFRRQANGSLVRIDEERDVSSGGSAEGLDAASAIAISPDGAHVYATAINDDTVVMFRRAANGGLVRVEEDRDVSSGGSAEGLDGARYIAVSPDGQNVYATSLNDDTVVVFRRTVPAGPPIR